MKNKLQLMNNELENIIGGFTFYLDEKNHPVLVLNKEENKFIKSYENSLASSISRISLSGELPSDASIYLTIKLLEKYGFTNSYEKDLLA